MPQKVHCVRQDDALMGEDCDFDVGLYSAVTAVLWILTALPLLAWAMPCLRRQWAASKRARASLVLAAVSAFCCFLDDVLKFREDGYGNQTLWSLGSIFLVFAIRAFSTTWCDVASALGSLHAPGHGGERLITNVRLTYKWMSMMHVPFALVFALHDYDFFCEERGCTAFEVVVRVYGAWLFFGTVVVLSGLSCAQYYIARVYLAGVEGVRSLQDTALINMVEQVLFDVLIFVYASLYLSDSESDGGNIAAYHAVGFIIFWAMHVQVVLFFAVLGNADPMYSQGDMDALFLKAADGPTRDIPPATVGTPTQTVDNAA
jgi:hypothetical protein